MSILVTGCAQGQDVDEQALAPKTESTKIYASDGTLVTILDQEEDREVSPIEDIPKHVRDAVIAIEDARYYTHRGIDLKAILRATYRNATTGRISEGGSTITQQLVRNALTEVGRKQTLERKFKEASYAYNVDEKYSKDKILELYLNTIYFGEGAYGVQTAAQAYFGKNVKDLSLAEGALLAGLIKSPVNYNPRTNADAALKRRNLVLDRMFKYKLAPPKDVAEAKGTDLGVQAKVDSAKYPAPYFVDYVTRLIQRSQEFSKLGETEQARGDSLFRKGLRIYTTLDLKMQAAAEEAISKVLDRENDPSATLAAIDPKNGYIKVLVGGKDYFAPPERDPCVRLGAVNADGSQKTCAKVNLALGQGGGGSGRQSGSAFKPFVLATALEKGIKLSDSYAAPSCIDIANADGGGTKPWHVCNYEEQGGGTMTLLEGTYRSMNTVYAQLIEDIGERKSSSTKRPAELGAKEVVTTAENLGLCETTRPLLPSGKSCALQPVPSAALGANVVSALDMASAFAAFPNLGVHAKPVAITRITDAKGNVLWEAIEEKKQVINPGVAYLTTDALQDVIAKGTAARYGKIGRPAFGKTGTAQEWRDAWFVGGAGTDLLASVSVFWPDGEVEMKPSCSGRRTEYRIDTLKSGEKIAVSPECRVTRIRVTGGSWPTQIWQLFMLKALEGIPASTFPVPDVDVVKVRVDISRGCLPNPYTPPDLVKSQTFIKGTEPTEVCKEPTGPTDATVPKVWGTPEDLAARILEGAGFVVVKKNDTANLPKYPPGYVTKQDPAEGTKSYIGATVTIWVAASSSTSTARVPNVVGLTEQNARTRIEQAGFVVEAIYRKGCGPGEGCTVVEQSPAAGTEAKTGSKVTIRLDP